MNDSERQLVFDVLLGDVSALRPEDLARKVLEDLALVQLNDLEPVIDRIAEMRAERRAA